MGVLGLALGKSASAQETGGARASVADASPEIAEVPEPESAPDFIEELAAVDQPIPFGREARDEDAWRVIRELIGDVLCPTENDSVAGRLSDQFLRVDYGFRFQPDSADVDFQPHHVEPLLDQAADLLDRCLRDRAQWDDISSRMFSLALELCEYRELDEIHREEEAAGIYDVDWKESRAEHAAETTNKSIHDWLKTFVGSTVTAYFSGERIGALSGWQQLSAWLQGLVLYTWKGQNFDGYIQHKWNGTARDPSGHWREAAFELSYHALAVEQRALIAQRESLGSVARVAARRLPGLSARADWNSVNRNFLRRRTLVARKYQDIKAKAATDADGILNYGKRLPGIRERFSADFRHALARLKAIQKGLDQLYGYRIPLPSEEADVDYYDQVLFWTRQTIQWLIRFSRVEQTIVLPVSIRTLVGDEAWDRGNKQKAWSFRFPKEALPTARHVRVRGLSAVVVDHLKLRDRLWQVELGVPARAEVVHLDGTVVTVDQSSVPPLMLGRVGERDAARDPDVAGLSSLHNASPFGEWQVRILDSVPRQHRTTKINDIQVDLHLSLRRR